MLFLGGYKERQRGEWLESGGGELSNRCVASLLLLSSPCQSNIHCDSEEGRSDFSREDDNRHPTENDKIDSFIPIKDIDYFIGTQ